MTIQIGRTYHGPHRHHCRRWPRPRVRHAAYLVASAVPEAPARGGRRLIAAVLAQLHLHGHTDPTDGGAR